MLYKALVIGCGNIGADYDFANEEILTHAKAYSCNKNIHFSVADIDEKKAQRVAKRYNTSYYTVLSDDDLRQFDIVSLCVNTKSHFDYLKRLIHLNIPVIVCEKPIVASIKEVIKIKKMNIHSAVLVNYIRRFQPGYQLLKRRLQKIIQKEDVGYIIVKYNRGVLNNASHALDLLTFLFEEEMSLEGFNLLSKSFESFDYDPTITGSFLFNNISVLLIGFESISYSIFEIDIYSKTWKISIRDSGNVIEYYKTKNKELVEVTSMRQKEILKNYMVPVVNQAIKCVNGNKKSNFNSALKINEDLLKLIEKI